VTDVVTVTSIEHIAMSLSDVRIGNDLRIPEFTLLPIDIPFKFDNQLGDEKNKTRAAYQDTLNA